MLVRSDEASCYVVSCAVEQAIWQGTEDSLQSTAREELSPANNHVISLAIGLSILLIILKNQVLFSLIFFPIDFLSSISLISAFYYFSYSLLVCFVLLFLVS